MKRLVIGILLALAIAGCGRKEPPQVLDPSGSPRLVELTHEVQGPSLVLNFRLLGDEEGIGYQIDRTEIDPYCKCPGFWRRYFEQEPMARQVNTQLNKAINLRVLDREFVFRIRAIDKKGRMSEWSEPIRAQAVDLMR